MTQVDPPIRTEESETSMWLKYKGNIAIEWTVGNVGGGDIFSWIDESSAGIEESSANSSYPFRLKDSKYLKLYLSDAAITKSFKKADLDLQFSDTFATQGDDGLGVKLDSAKAYDVNNSMNIKGYLESDLLRSEQPFTSGGLGYGPQMEAYSLPQKELLLHDMAKRSGVQGFSGEHPSSSFQNPVTVYTNYGMNHNNYNNFLRYLMISQLKTFTQAKQEITQKWMPYYVENWNWTSSITKSMIYKGFPYAGKPYECVELVYSNCVLDDIQIKEDSNSKKIEVELRLLFDTNNNRWTANRYLMTPGNFSTGFESLEPHNALEAAPAGYIGPDGEAGRWE